ncbi:MAG TPA: pilin [Casimicrobiaceae bacterium]|nr:pilin [Casimicrobiaceae bacterium]
MDRSPASPSTRRPRASWPRRAAQGFTLIELMIVVAIVGILSAIAIPQYQIYTGRAQLAEAIHLTEARKSAIAEALIMGVAMSDINGGGGGIPDDVTSSAARYVDSLVVASGAIVVTMKSTGVSPCVIGASVTLAPVPPSMPDLAVSWICSSTAICKPSTCA